MPVWKYTNKNVTKEEVSKTAGEIKSMMEM